MRMSPGMSILLAITPDRGAKIRFFCAMFLGKRVVASLASILPRILLAWSAVSNRRRSRPLGARGATGEISTLSILAITPLRIGNWEGRVSGQVALWGVRDAFIFRGPMRNVPTSCANRTPIRNFCHRQLPQPAAYAFCARGQGSAPRLPT